MPKKYQKTHLKYSNMSHIKYTLKKNSVYYSFKVYTLHV